MLKLFFVLFVVALSACRVNVDKVHVSKYEKLAAQGDYKGAIRSLSEDIVNRFDADSYLKYFNVIEDRLSKVLFTDALSEDKLDAMELELDASMKELKSLECKRYGENSKSLKTLVLLEGETKQDVYEKIRAFREDYDYLVNKERDKRSELKIIQLEIKELEAELEYLKNSENDEGVEKKINSIKGKILERKRKIASLNRIVKMLRSDKAEAKDIYYSYLISHNARANPEVLRELNLQIIEQKNDMINGFVDYIYELMKASIRNRTTIDYGMHVSTYLNLKINVVLRDCSN